MVNRRAINLQLFFLLTRNWRKKMKNFLTITTAVLLLICFSTTQARADRKTMERFMIGTGAAILGAVIFSEINSNSNPRYGRHHPARPIVVLPPQARHRRVYETRYQKSPRHNRTNGHWEAERIWNPPVYERKWNPGHYTPRGEWVNGRNEGFLIREGYWQEEKVWVRH